jgi:Raf kinase inhibitor-like YbhB/YbcL family protein
MSTQSLLLSFLLAPAAALLSATPPPQPVEPHTSPEQKANKQVTGHIYVLEKRPPPPVTKLKVPNGFRIERFAENLGHARLLAVGPGGNIYLTRRDQGDVLMLKPGANGLAAGAPVRVASRPGMHGIGFHANKVYLATIKEVFRADVNPDGTFGPLEMIIHDLPDAGQHPTRTVQVGPDNMLYIGIASATNDAIEPNPEAATLVRASLDGKSRAIFASGLRDVIGWGWHPQTGELWGLDHGIDWLGDEEQPEELNLIEKGKHYGWPYFFGKNGDNVNRFPPGGITKDEMRKAVTPMTLGYTAHAGPMQASFYTGSQFPEEYRGDLFVSMRGSWNRKPASGYEVVRVRFQNGKPAKFEPFVTGFLDGNDEYGRLTGNVVAPDGSLLFTDDRNGVIYRVSYAGRGAPTGAAVAAAPMAIPAEPMRRQNREGVKEPLAHEMPAMKAKAPQALELAAESFADGQPIPEKHSAYDQNVSPTLRWKAGPAETQSYVVLMEDPDASITPLPVVHWVAWNIPADTTELREGLPPMEGLNEPKGMRQGMNSLGRPGFFGSKPPKGDPAHRYYYQVFALDKKLDLPPGATRQQVIEASQGHVLATGVVHGRFARPAEPKRP